jgi:hypothetical protein
VIDNQRVKRRDDDVDEGDRNANPAVFLKEVIKDTTTVTGCVDDADCDRGDGGGGDYRGGSDGDDDNVWDQPNDLDKRLSNDKTKN